MLIEIQRGVGMSLQDRGGEVGGDVFLEGLHRHVVEEIATKMPTEGCGMIRRIPMSSSRWEYGRILPGQAPAVGMIRLRTVSDSPQDQLRSKRRTPRPRIGPWGFVCLARMSTAAATIAAAAAAVAALGTGAVLSAGVMACRTYVALTITSFVALEVIEGLGSTLG